MSQRIPGTVKWYNSVKGYGFICSDKGDDIFVHFSALHGKGIHMLEEGQRVEFSVEDNPKGLQATNVVLL